MAFPLTSSPLRLSPPSIKRLSEDPLVIKARTLAEIAQVEDHLRNDEIVSIEPL